MSFENICVETQGAVGIITFSRPKALNALNDALIAEMNTALRAFDADPAIQLYIACLYRRFGNTGTVGGCHCFFRQ